MSTDTPRPTRAGAIVTVEETEQYETITQEFINQCAYFLNMFNETLPNIPAPAPQDNYTEDGRRVQYVADLAQATQWDNAVKRARRRLQDELERGTIAHPPSGARS